MSDGGLETKKMFCDTCKFGTNHILRATYLRHRVVLEDDGALYEPGDVISSIWSCAGCDEETFEWVYQAEGDEPNARYFPERSGDSIQPKHFLGMDPKLRRIYEETIHCFNRDCLVLCTIGVGALLEGVCNEKGLTGKTRIDDLYKFVPNPNVIQALKDFVDARNDAAHRLDARTRSEAGQAIELIEDLLNFLYALDYKAQQARIGSKRAAFDAVKPGRVQ